MGKGSALLLDTPDEGVCERHASGDRRRTVTPMISRYAFFGGNRRAARRRAERDGAFVDTHGTGLFLVVTGVATLNILDAFFTVLFLSYGAKEINPVVQMALDVGIWWFVILKSVGIGVCLLFLTMTKNFLVSRIGLGIVCVGYTVLLGWHGYLYTLVP